MEQTAGYRPACNQTIELPLARDCDLVLRAIGDDAIAGQKAIVIEHEVQLDSTLGAAEFCPVEDRCAEFNRRGVDRQQFILETELVPGACLLGMAARRFEQSIENILEQLARLRACEPPRRNPRAESTSIPERKYWIL